MVLTPVKGKYYCPHDYCDRHQHPFDTHAQLRGHLGSHSRKSRKKQKPSPNDKACIMKAFQTAPNNQLTTKEIVNLLAINGSTNNHNTRTLVSVMAKNPANCIKRIDRGLYKWSSPSQEIAVSSPETEAFFNNPEILKQELFRANVKIQKLQEIVMVLVRD